MKKANFILLVLAIIAIILTAGILVAKANPSSVLEKPLAAATSTVTYMTPGTATTTLTLDTYGATGMIRVAESAALMVQYTGSTSAAVIDHTVEYSMDGIDWYGQDLTPSVIAVSQGTLHHASSTAVQRWGAGSSTASTTRRAFVYPVLARYIRATFTVPIGTDNGALWAKFVAKKEIPE